MLTHLLNYLDDIHTRTPSLTVKTDLTETEMISSNLLSLVEEVGEVTAEVRKLTRLSFNQKKCDAFDQKNLEDEIVDVLITTILLSKRVGISSLDKAIQRKIEKNQARWY